MPSIRSRPTALYRYETPVGGWDGRKTLALSISEADAGSRRESTTKTYRFQNR